MLPEQDALDLIAGLERASQRSRPYVIFGLLAMLAGFVILAVYLNHQRQVSDSLRASAEQLAAEQTVRVRDLTATLNNARLIATEQHPPEQSADQWQRLTRLLRLATGDVASLGETVTTYSAESSPPVVVAAQMAPPPTQAAPAATPAPAQAQADPTPSVIRFWLHIVDESQRADAQKLATSWAGRSIGGVTIVVPGIELAQSDPEDTIRCTKRAACAGERFKPVTDWVNANLDGRSLRPVDLSRTYGNARGIRPGTYELWFGPGPIAAKGS